MDRHSSSDSKKLHSGTIYQAIWRWHLYAGIIFAPFILILAVTGSVYLFKPQIEQRMYQDYYVVKDEGNKLQPSQLIDTVKAAYPEYNVLRYRPGEDATRSAEVKLGLGDEKLTIFVDPYSSTIIGELNDRHRLMDRIEEFHGELMLGTFGDRIVELAACWALILVITGLYLWIPRDWKKWKGVIVPRINTSKRNLLRDLHVVPAFWISAAMVFLIITGLLWSGFWGTKVQTLVTNSGLGYPPSIWVGSAPSSTLKTKDIADVPWAAENLEVPLSNPSQEYTQLSINNVVNTANQLQIYPTYEVIFPKSAEGVFTLSVFPPKARDEATVHIDQYTGAVLADYRYEHYEVLGKWMAWGITLHKGLEYGLLNQWIGLIVCIGIAGIVITGFLLWWRRKPKTHMGAPRAQSYGSIKGIVILLIIYGMLFPLVGLSLIVVALLDVLVITRSAKLRQIFNS
ncbi:PepSY-associated TM helix domain-containing protein [Paenibacillus massiliensis]|uniref:PepSY-associated TM helix domain-containing protein n=1 Tax=Paenibacillus massiliensis TaxID=225917 RepID=UPI00040D66C3|nr:PepSY domain-containing protein [Paenibacillus massiliensis]